MVCFKIRDLINTQTKDLQLPKTFQIKFDDGVIVNTTDRKTLYSSYFWDIFRCYYNTPVINQHHVDYVLKGEPLNSTTHTKLLTIILKSVVEDYNLNTPEKTEHILGMIYQVTNNIHNEVSKLAEANVSSIDILDFIDVVEYPPIKNIISNIEPNKESIGDAYTEVNKIIRKDIHFTNNPLVKAIRAGIINNNQINQCLIARGFVTEVDGAILPVPVLTNYTRGMKTLYEYTAESRSAAKSYYFSESPLQDAEYFARRLQLLTMSVEKISYHDCGSTKYMNWRVKPPEINENGVKVYQGDLVFMIGKYYLNEETNQLQQITHDDPSLYNKLLKLRSVIYCQDTNPHNVCEVCFGALAKNVSRFTNIGHLCAATMTQQTSQSVLSIKHLDMSSISVAILLNELSSQFFTLNRAKNAYIVRKDMKSKIQSITIARDDAIGLTDILNIDDIENINALRVSSIEYIDITYVANKQEFTIPVFINQGTRKAILTMEFLTYLQSNPWITNDKNNFVFDLNNWNFALPIFRLPDVEYSFSDHSHAIAKVIESSMKNITDRTNPHSPISTLQGLFHLVNTKLNVNIAALEVIIYAAMITSKNNYAMGRNTEQPVLGIADSVIKGRSLSNAYAYEEQLDTITDPESFFQLNRPSSIFDVAIAPLEVVEELHRA